MPISHVNLHYPLHNGTMVVQFSFLRTAQAYARELGLATYKITCGATVLESR